MSEKNVNFINKGNRRNWSTRFFHAWSTEFPLFLHPIHEIWDFSLSDWWNIRFFFTWSTSFMIFPCLIDENCTFSTFDRWNMLFSTPDQWSLQFLTDCDEIFFFSWQIHEFCDEFPSVSTKFSIFSLLIDKICKFFLFRINKICEFSVILLAIFMCLINKIHIFMFPINEISDFFMPDWQN